MKKKKIFKVDLNNNTVGMCRDINKEKEGFKGCLNDKIIRHRKGKGTPLESGRICFSDENIKGRVSDMLERTVNSCGSKLLNYYMNDEGTTGTKINVTFEILDEVVWHEVEKFSESELRRMDEIDYIYMLQWVLYYIESIIPDDQSISIIGKDSAIIDLKKQFDSFFSDYLKYRNKSESESNYHFRTFFSALNHFYRHRKINKRELTVDDYFNMASKYTKKFYGCYGKAVSGSKSYTGKGTYYNEIRKTSKSGLVDVKSMIEYINKKKDEGIFPGMKLELLNITDAEPKIKITITEDVNKSTKLILVIRCKTRDNNGKPVFIDERMRNVISSFYEA